VLLESALKQSRGRVSVIQGQEMIEFDRTAFWVIALMDSAWVLGIAALLIFNPISITPPGKGNVTKGAGLA